MKILRIKKKKAKRVLRCSKKWLYDIPRRGLAIMLPAKDAVSVAIQVASGFDLYPGNHCDTAQLFL